MRLYFAPGACSLSVHIALREAGLDFDTVRVDLSSHTTEGGSDYYAISPRGYVPLLELDDGSRHTEASALLQYVGSRAAAEKLLPEFGSAPWLETVEWLTFISTELHKGFGPLWAKDIPEATKQMAKARLNKRFGELEKHLAGNEYLTGRFSVADAYCFTIVSWSKIHQIDLAPYPNLNAYLGRIAQRPKVQEALKAEGLTAG